MNASLDLFSSGFKRIFILYSNTGVTAPTFSPRSLATLGGRMDVVSRAAIGAFLDLKNRIREDVVFIAVLMGPPDPPRIIYIDPSDMSKVKNLSEEEMGNIILEQLRKTPTVEEKQDIIDLVDMLYKNGFKVYLLIEDGTDIEHYIKSGHLSQKKLAFIIGDHIGFPNDLVKQLTRKSYPVSLGKKSYLASHCVIFLNEILDNVSLSR
ncbi:MAG: hypothetical protein DRJ35_01610 [Thermoprotei archaeon]|nr:MAG: hypothetical protein DRJ35_01610 [Thermoprotei archaeon]